MSTSYLSVLMARTPGQPQDLIQVLETTMMYIHVQIPEVTDNGGSTILAYQLAIDDGLQGDFKIVYEGIERNQVISDGLI